MFKALVFGVIALLSSVSAQSQSTAEATLPSSLKDWRAWVLKDEEYRSCPFLSNVSPKSAQDFVCAWPARLTINAADDGATFSIHWQVQTTAWIPLPGDLDHWPQQVTVNNQRQPVVSKQSAPMLRLAPGSYDIAGRIPWKHRPQNIRVPNYIGIVALSVDGKSIAPVERREDLVTLGRSNTEAPVSDSLQIRVYRKLTDGVPAQLETHLELASSGQAREEIVGPVLPDGFAPLSLTSEWPARLDDDGRLRIQVQAGVDELIIKARATAPLSKITARLAAAPWPTQETWSYEAATDLRVTSATSAIQVDSRQAGAPDEWRGFPAFALSDGGVLQIEERSRGLGANEGNRLTLQREAWLDFSGDGWYARDRISGDMLRGWRLDVAAPYVLERADALNSSYSGNSSGEPLLVTRGAKAESSGVEWRTPTVDLAAGVRVISASSTMPVAGWQETFDHIDTTLHLPFGYRLIAAPGADSASGSWMSQWTLLDAFVCAILVLLAWRILGTLGAVISSAYLLLAYQEGAPFWTLLVVIALALIVRALPQGKLRGWTEGARRVILLLLILAALPFVADQLRVALYPQLEQGSYFAEPQSTTSAVVDAEKPIAIVAGKRARFEPRALPSPMAVPAPAPPPPAREVAGQSLQTIVVTGSNIQRVDLIDHYSESTVVQTGVGEPTWNLGPTALLSWTGPVLAGQTMHLLLAPPWLVRALHVVLVALLGWLIWQLSSGAVRSIKSRVPLNSAVLLIAGLMLAPVVQAQNYPSDQLLQQLHQRLTEAPKCAPDCASIGEALIGANGDAITVSLDAQALDAVALPLPDTDASIALTSIKVDGTVNDGVVRATDGNQWIGVTRGVHRVDITYTAYADKISLKFPLVPGRVQFNGTGWESSGINDNRLLADALNLTRAHANASDKIVAGAQQFPPYVSVVRNLLLGLKWTTQTDVMRLAPDHGGMTVSVPQIDGEHATSANAKTDGNNVLATIADGSDTTNWQSVLDKSDVLTLTAPALGERSEVWRIVVSPTWHAEFSGVPETVSIPSDEKTKYRNFEFHPLPGETLTIKVTRPTPVQGNTQAIDSVTLDSQFGQHAATHTLKFQLRASQGGEHAIELPKEADVINVLRDGQVLNVRPLNGKVSLPITPGQHEFTIVFRENADLSTRATTPPVSFGLAAANITLTTSLPEDRWLLATWGPRVGPAVLYWGELLVMILVAYALSRTRRTKLRFVDWLLLGIGFSTFSWTALIVVVAWLFAFDWRSRTTLTSDRTFNLAQFGLAALTVIALLCLISAIPQGLLGQPDMHVTGFGSSAHALQWFDDRSTDALPQASAITLPLWLYKVLMLVWALWLANALIGWLRHAFAAWTADGYWRARKKVEPPIVPTSNTP
jgi:hypothetical protein